MCKKKCNFAQNFRLMILIADSGSTKVHWCMMTASGQSSDVRTDGINPVFQTVEQIQTCLTDQLLPQLAKWLWAGTITHVFFYGAGCTPEKKVLVEQALSAVFKKAEVFVASDMLGAARGLLGHKAGVACILGTGSGSCFYNGETIDDKLDDLGDQFTDFVHLKDEGDQGSRTTGIGATVNLGAEYTLPSYKKLKFGFLSSTRLQGDFSWTEGRLSANYSPLKWLNGGVSAAVSSFGASMGWVVNIHPKGLNLFVGMDRLLGKVSKQGIPLNSNTSVSMGMNITW